jgi:hypothetical protein
MTRKDYILIARVIATSWHASAEFKRELSENMADALESDNPRFNRLRFLVACGVYEEERLALQKSLGLI